ncbi:hypothetical protein ARTHRO8AJ_150023 [Arthrobacter sp. 8AJ]|nr:hypothetical protein ARTHRO8AJ_150023 [Arthrobacter sp. 8AJ]
MQRYYAFGANDALASSPHFIKRRDCDMPPTEEAPAQPRSHLP